ncbi:MAG TPA: SDR family oxidoreductase [Candidatus Rubrimentiphilum sp.]|nr:SDR family oxidoreductase [Candidatus Rubrimentiphilum sp.]
MSRTIIVTGGSMGIGKAVAERCLRGGANVFFCAREKGALERTLDELQAEFPSMVGAETADISREQDVTRLFESARRRFGDVHAVIHAAAVLGPIGTIVDVDPRDWLRTIEIDLFGAFLVAREACRQMKSTGGRIVLFSGGGASAALPHYSAYASSKAAVVRLTETIAGEMAQFGIEINCLAPGFVITRMHEQTLAAGSSVAGEEYYERTKREVEAGGASPDAAAEAAAFLASDAAKGITGKFVSAVYDGWREWPAHASQLRASDIFTLRRIVPKDRGMDWQ